MTRPNALPHSGWVVRLIAGLLCLAVAMPAAASAWAQQTGPSVVITGVDSRSFPTVTANLTVTGNNGLPLVGLTADNFSIQEDGKAVAPATAALNSDISQQLNLVLAFDISVNAAGLSQMQAAATDFVATLGPTDQVAILSFYDQVDQVQSFTSDKRLLTTAIKNLTAGGNGTVFNQAADKAVNLLAALPAGRKALIIMTNSGDTTNNLSPQATITNAQAAQVRIYPFAFTSNVNPKLMNNWAKFTGGQAYLLASADEIRPNLLTLGVLMRQSYRLSFKSGLKADNKAHALTIVLNYQGQSGQGQSTFTALPGQVTVVGPGIGQSVRGMVFLIVEVTSPAPVASVMFLLDDVKLANLTSPPYRFDWDTTTALPGTHTLTIKATDQVGNVGQSQMSVNVVLPPPAVVTATPAATPAPAAGGGQIQTFTARATGILGRVAAGLALLVALIISLLLWLRSLAAQRLVQVKTCAVEVSNQGNVRSRYEVRAEDPSGMLKFEFMLDDTDLAQRVGEPVDARTAAGAVPAQTVKGEKVGSGTIAQVKGVVAKADALENKAMATVNTGSLISNWIVNISYILPGPLGNTLRNSTAGLRSTQYDVRNAVDAPGRYRRMVAAAAPPTLSGGNPNGPMTTNTVTVPWAKTTPSGNGATTQATIAHPKPVARSGWSLTPPVDAGEALTIQMKVRPSHRPKSQHYDFQVLSRSVDGNEDTPVIDHGSVALRGAPMRRLVMSWLLLGITLVLLALLAWYVLMTFNIIH